MDKNRLAARGAVVLACAWLVLEMIRGGVAWTPALAASAAGLWLLKARDQDGSWIYSTRAVFLGCLAVYLSTLRWHGGDDAPNSLIPFCLLRHGTLALNPVLAQWFTGKTNDFTVTYGANTLSVYPIAPGMLALPVYILPVLAGVVPSEQFIHNLSKISGSLIVAASAAVFHRALIRRCSREWALCLAALYGLGSWSLSVSSQALWQHGPAQLGAALGLLGLERAGFGWDCLSGFGFGLAVAARPDNVFYAAGIGLFVLIRRARRAAGFTLGAAVPAILLASYWLHYTGRLRPPESDFQKLMFVGFQLKAFVGLLLSPTRGLLLFFPAVVFGIWGGWRRRSEDGVLLLVPCLITAIFMSFYVNWTGGGTFGPRYFATAALVLTYLCADLEQPIRSNAMLLRSWCEVAAASMLIHASGGYFTWPGGYVIGEQVARLWWWRLHPVLNLFFRAGPLGGLPAFARVGVAGSIVAAFAALARWMRRRLAYPAAPVV